MKSKKEQSMKPGDTVRLQKKHSTGKKKTAKIEAIDGILIILDKPIYGRRYWPHGERYLEIVPKKKDADSE